MWPVAREGPAVGQYEPGSIATLEAAISAADSVFQKRDVTLEELEQSTEHLIAATALFESKVVSAAD